jgi:hypothetical protein
LRHSGNGPDPCEYDSLSTEPTMCKAEDDDKRQAAKHEPARGIPPRYFQDRPPAFHDEHDKKNSAQPSELDKCLQDRIVNLMAGQT